MEGQNAESERSHAISHICLQMLVIFVILIYSVLLHLCLQVAILVPFRNRHEHLPILFRHLVPVLRKQRLQFAFYVVEQVYSHMYFAGSDYLSPVVIMSILCSRY